MGRTQWRSSERSDREQARPRTVLCRTHPERITDAAVELTRESHLLNWSIRDLAGRLDVAPSVIYHHVGGKDLVCRRVVESALSHIELPPLELGWQEWFRELLYAIGPSPRAIPTSPSG